MAKNEWRFPQYLSKPFQILWFDLDDLLFFLFFLYIGQTVGGIFWFLVIIGPYISTKIKRNFARGFGNHFMYFLGLNPIRGYPDFFIVEFLE